MQGPKHYKCHTIKYVNNPQPTNRPPWHSLKLHSDKEQHNCKLLHYNKTVFLIMCDVAVFSVQDYSWAAERLGSSLLLLGGSSLKFPWGSWPCDPKVWLRQLSSMEMLRTLQTSHALCTWRNLDFTHKHTVCTPWPSWLFLFIVNCLSYKMLAFLFF